MAYQDRWVRGATEVWGERACAARYEFVQAVVAEYRRPITLWDLGANLGYFGCRVAEETGSVAVMVESRPELVQVCRENALPTTIALSHRLSAIDLQELAASEHADVVLCLNVLHHLRDWAQALDAVLALGQDVMIETPGRDDTGTVHYARAQAILDALERMDGTVVAVSSSHVTVGIQRPVYRFHRPKSALTAGYAYRGLVRARGPHPPRAHTIVSTPDAKTVTFEDGPARPWLPGVNLWNWLQMGGSYPDRTRVKRLVQRAYDAIPAPHGDFRPWNLILQGQTVQVIDGGHRASLADAVGLMQTLAWIDSPQLAYAR